MQFRKVYISKIAHTPVSSIGAARRSIKNCCTQTQHSGNVWGVDECESSQRGVDRVVWCGVGGAEGGAP